MATTPGDYEIYYPLASDEIAPLQAHFSTLATSVSDAFDEFITPLRDGLQTKNYKVDTFSQLTALTGVIQGSRGYVTTTKSHYMYDGVAWRTSYIPWTTYAPTAITGLTFNTARYTVSNNMVTVNIRATKGTTASTFTSLSIQLPLTSAAILDSTFPIGQGVFRKNVGNKFYPLVITHNTTGQATVYWQGGSPVVLGTIDGRASSTNKPAKVENTDEFLLNFTYSL
jgi:hypothetical protein